MARSAFDDAQTARNAAKVATTAQDAALNNARLNAADLIRVIKGFAEQQANPGAASPMSSPSRSNPSGRVSQWAWRSCYRSGGCVQGNADQSVRYEPRAGPRSPPLHHRFPILNHKPRHALELPRVVCRQHQPVRNRRGVAAMSKSFGPIPLPAAASPARIRPACSAAAASNAIGTTVAKLGEQLKVGPAIGSVVRAVVQLGRDNGRNPQMLQSRGPHPFLYRRWPVVQVS